MAPAARKNPTNAKTSDWKSSSNSPVVAAGVRERLAKRYRLNNQYRTSSKMMAHMLSTQNAGSSVENSQSNSTEKVESEASTSSASDSSSSAPMYLGTSRTRSESSGSANDIASTSTQNDEPTTSEDGSPLVKQNLASRSIPKPESKSSNGSAILDDRDQCRSQKRGKGPNSSITYTTSQKSSKKMLEVSNVKKVPAEPTPTTVPNTSSAHSPSLAKDNDTSKNSKRMNLSNKSIRTSEKRDQRISEARKTVSFGPISSSTILPKSPSVAEVEDEINRNASEIKVPSTSTIRTNNPTGIPETSKVTKTIRQFKPRLSHSSRTSGTSLPANRPNWVLVKKTSSRIEAEEQKARIQTLKALHRQSKARKIRLLQGPPAMTQQEVMQNYERTGTY